MINDIHTKYPAPYKAKDGHFVRSKAELLIDNWFYEKRIVHAYELDIVIPNDPMGEVTCDWYLPDYDCYVEYFGMTDDPKYAARMKQKIAFYERNRLNLVALEDEDIGRLDKRLDKLFAEHVEKETPRYCQDCNIQINNLPANYKYCPRCFNW